MDRPFLFLMNEKEYLLVKKGLAKLFSEASVESDLDKMAERATLSNKLKDQHDIQLTEDRGIEEYQGNTAELPEAEI